MDIYEAFFLSTGVDVGRFSMKGKCLGHTKAENGFALCEKLCEDAKKCEACHRSALENALMTGETFIYRCHEGFVFATAPVRNEQGTDGAVCCGPCLLWNAEEEEADEAKYALLEKIAVLTPERMQAVSDMLYNLSVRLSGKEDSVLVENRERSQRQMDVANGLSDAKKDDRLVAGYPLHLEKELLGRVRLGDRNGAKALLNGLLGRVFTKSAGNINVTKARLLELVVMISRAAVESGAETESLFGMNSRYIDELFKAQDFEEVCVWVIRALDAFMDAVYSSRNTRQAQILGDATAYIAQNLSESLSLESVAGAIHLSPYYLSHLFKEELDVTFLEYVTGLRIAEAKRMLRGGDDTIFSIASRLGFRDADYFGKVFKRETGMTPKAYRKHST